MLLHRLAIDHDVSVTWLQQHASHCLFSSTDRREGVRVATGSHEAFSSVVAFNWPWCGCTAPSYTRRRRNIARPSALCGSIPLTACSTTNRGLRAVAVRAFTSVNPPGNPE